MTGNQINCQLCGRELTVRYLCEHCFSYTGLDKEAVLTRIIGRMEEEKEGNFKTLYENSIHDSALDCCIKIVKGEMERDEMSTEQARLNKLGAKVMGWICGKHTPSIGARLAWFSKGGYFKHYDNDWDPCESINQAFMVVDTVLKQNEDWNFTLELDREICSALFYESAEGMICHGSGEAPLGQKGLAIMRAIEEATTEKS